MEHGNMENRTTTPSLDIGTQMRILALTGCPAAWMASLGTIDGMVAVITKERWCWTGILAITLEMMHHEKWRPSTFRHYYGIELIIHAIKKKARELEDDTRQSR